MDALQWPSSPILPGGGTKPSPAVTSPTPAAPTGPSQTSTVKLGPTEEGQANSQHIAALSHTFSPQGTPAAGDAAGLGTNTLRSGMKNQNVQALQGDLLKQLGGNLKTDGKFGPQTQQAVRQFQQQHHLKVDGVVGAQTRGALQQGQGSPAAGQGTAAAGQGAPAASQPASPDATPKAGATNAAPATGPGTQDDSWTQKLPKGLQSHAQDYVNAGKKYNVDPRFLASISMQETGNGTSSAFRKKNNAMGISGTGGPKKFASVSDSINKMAKGLADPDGYYKGAKTVSQVAGIYAPIGAKNDPGNLNVSWRNNVTRNFENFGGDPSQPVLPH